MKKLPVFMLIPPAAACLPVININFNVKTKYIGSVHPVPLSHTPLARADVQMKRNERNDPLITPSSDAIHVNDGIEEPDFGITRR